MAFLIAILIALVLFVAFLGLTAWERKRGMRLFSRSRETLDARIAHAAVNVRTADPLAFVIRGARTLFGHIFHDIAMVTWGAVRLLERTLENAVRKLGLMRGPAAPRTETNSSFVKSISFHKRTLRPQDSSSEETAEDTVG